MTPAARIQAAIDILDRIATGTPAEQALTNWGRNSRFAGSGDRHAVRDHVFDVLRRWRSTAAMGGADTGRGRMIGLLRQQGIALETLFTGLGHAPSPLTPEETILPDEILPGDACDCPDWLVPHFEQSLGARTSAVLDILKGRAPIFLRVNSGKTTRDLAQAALATEGIVTRPHEHIKTALEVVEGERKVSASMAYETGLVEIQDASSQAACGLLNLDQGLNLLDYCAGGGGKSLALAARGAQVTAHDINPGRMRDIEPRAARAGVSIAQIRTADLGAAKLFDVVFCDAPCSGSGTWRRTPEAKWQLTPTRLDELNQLQDQVLAAAQALVRPGGHLAYATCSVFQSENEARITHFLKGNPGFELVSQTRWDPDQAGDGFYLAQLVASN